MKKNWNNPELKNLAVEATNEDGPVTLDLPHGWICNKCGAHYRGVATGGTKPFTECQCGACDWRWSACEAPESGVYVQP